MMVKGVKLLMLGVALTMLAVTVQQVCSGAPKTLWPNGHIRDQSGINIWRSLESARYLGQSLPPQTLLRRSGNSTGRRKSPSGVCRSRSQ